MEFGFKLESVFDIDKNGFILLNGRELQKKCQSLYTGRSREQSERLMRVLDRIGEASSKAQGLGAVITNFSRLAFSNHKLYMRVANNAVIGFIKVGEKSLCYRQPSGKFIEVLPLCVLDFYVDERFQRHGYGKEIFEYMLRCENVLPEKLAIDRPSFKFLSFLKKHYQLAKYSPQSNNFVIFDQFFQPVKSENCETGQSTLPTTFAQPSPLDSKLHIGSNELYKKFAETGKNILLNDERLRTMLYDPRKQKNGENQNAYNR